MMMKENLDGLLGNAGDAAKKGDKMYGRMYAYSLKELAKNLRDLRDRTRAGDMKALDEFFSIYVFGEDNQ